jgi:hypothetical protein
MEHSVARGQATLIHLKDARPFQLFWHHGAFFSTERLIAIESSSETTVPHAGRSSLDLQRVFTSTAKGLGLLSTADGASHTFGLATNCFDCLFASPSSNAAAGPPVFEIRGGQAPESPSTPLEVNGSNNFYKGYSVFAEFVPSDATDAVRQYTFDELRDTDDSLWFRERSPQPATMFSWSEPQTPVHAQTLTDYLGTDAGGEAFTYTLGFEPTQLPPLPATNVSSLESRFDWDASDR